MRLKEEEIAALKEVLTGKDEAVKILQKKIGDLEKEAETFRAFVERKKDVIERETKERQTRQHVNEAEIGNLRKSREISPRENNAEEEEDLFEVITVDPDESGEESDSSVSTVELVNNNNDSRRNSTSEADDITADFVEHLQSENERICAENERLTRELRELRQLKGIVESPQRKDVDENPYTENALVPVAASLSQSDSELVANSAFDADSSLVANSSLMNTSNSAVLDSYILSQSPVFYFLAQVNEA